MTTDFRDRTDNIALFGLSGSGKDTIANYLKDEYNYFPIRIAGTIKQIIMEKHNLTFDELEEQKRINPNLRQEHHDIGEQTYSNNRLLQILSGRNFEIQKYKDDYQSVVIIDGRGLDFELPEILKNNNWYVILLSRIPNSEYRNTSNYTEQFNIESALKVVKNYNTFGKTILILNNEEEIKLDSETEELARKCLGYFNISGKATKQNLLATIDYIFNNDLIQ